MGDVVPVAVLGAVIGANNLAVALALGSLGQSGRSLRIVLVFGVFEFTMPLLGTALGRELSTLIADRVQWLSPGLLLAVGAWTAWGALSEEIDVEELAARAGSWGGLVVLAATLSLDNLVVGFSLGLRALSPLALATLISAFSMAFAAIGLRVGRVAHRNAPRIAGVASGVLLVGLGILLATGTV